MTRNLVISALFSTVAAFAGEHGQAENLGALKFELLDQHLIVVRGAIGALQGMKLLIDTGSNPSMVDRRVAKKLGLRFRTSEFVAFGHKSHTLTAVLPNISLGPLHVEAATVGVGDLSFLHGVDAVVGLDVLSRASFSIDYKERRVSFGPMPARQPSVRLDVSPPFLTVRLSISGRLVRLLVDTGSSRLVLFERRVHDMAPLLPFHGELSFNHLSGTSRLNRVLLMDLELGGLTINRLEGFMSDSPVEGYPAGIDGVLGLRAVATKHADFDFERSRLAF
jgi:predicted aspartyl protease